MVVITHDLARYFHELAHLNPYFKGAVEATLHCKLGYKTPSVGI